MKMKAKKALSLVLISFGCLILFFGCSSHQPQSKKITKIGRPYLKVIVKGESTKQIGKEYNVYAVTFTARAFYYENENDDKPEDVTTKATWHKWSHGSDPAATNADFNDAPCNSAGGNWAVPINKQGGATATANATYNGCSDTDSEYVKLDD